MHVVAQWSLAHCLSSLQVSPFALAATQVVPRQYAPAAQLNSHAWPTAGTGMQLPSVGGAEFAPM
jgi:hypothetical protein